MLREYSVIRRSSQYWVIYDGTTVGPYISFAVAEAAAISLAKMDFKVGRSARVTVEDKENRVVYDSTTDENQA